MRDDRPNVVIVTTDQQRRDTLSGYGAEFTATPNLDRLGREGVFFDRAYCTNPTCTPARASLFSGLYPSRHGAWNIGTNVSEDLPMISHRLGAAGYRTHYVGKAHFEASGGGSASVEAIGEWRNGAREGWNGPYHGFESVELALGHATYGLNGHYGAWLRSRLSEEEIEAIANGAICRAEGPDFGGEAYDWNMPSRLHNSVWTADRAIDFLKNAPRSTPFLLAIGFQDPHHPHCVPTDFDDRVDPAAVPLPRFAEGELDDKPRHFADARAGRLETGPYRGDHFVGGQGPGYDYRRAVEGDVREGRAYYHTLVRLIDREMGRILESLDELGLAENTIVVFTTDHGELLGDHGIWLKGPFHYEELVRVPLIVRWPRRIPGGRRHDAPVSHVDVVPTLLEAADVDGAGALDGASLLGQLAGEEARSREHAFVECVDDPRGLRLKTIVTREWKATLYHGERFGELYDLRNDPGELRNLWDDPEYQRTRAELVARIADHLERIEPRVQRHSYA